MKRQVWLWLVVGACGGKEDGGTGPGDDTGAPGVDADGDGYASLATGGDDCDDEDPAVHPGAPEACDGNNNDCDGGIDESDATDATTWYRDADGDGYPDQDSAISACERPPGYRAAGAWDCDDGSPDANPGAAEICNDGLDNNCNGDEAECRLSGALSLAEADFVRFGASGGDAAGTAQTSSDLDGDGWDDLVVGAPYANTAGTDSGAVFVVFGPVSGSAGLDAAGAVLAGGSASHNAGQALAAAGDMDADGYDDLVVGAWSANGGGNDSGEVYVAFGPVSGTSSLADAGVRIVGENAYDYAGWSLASDGVDVYVGAYGSGDDSDQQRGAAYRVAGPLSGTLDLGAAEGVLRGDQKYDRAGWTVAVGDLDGDGLTDLVTGAYTWPGNDGQGAAVVALGPLEGALAAEDAQAILAGEDEEHQAGSALALGDVDGDGRDDLLVGAWNATIDAEEQGAAYLVHGPVTGAWSLGLAPVRLTGEDARDQAGAAVALADLDGDGHADLLVGAPAHDGDGRDAGAAYLFHGPVSGRQSLGSADLVATGASDQDKAGLAVAMAGDPTGDGLLDILVGAPGESTAAADAGAVYGIAGAGP